MPNWCSNELEITGDKEVIIKFLEGLMAIPANYDKEKPITEPCYTLNSYVPVPEEIKAKPYSPDFSSEVPTFLQECGYNWQVEHWGVKWDCFANEAFEYEMKRIWAELAAKPKEHTSITLRFETAWAPIKPWVIKVAKLFPRLLTFQLHYLDEGPDFGGVLIVEGDEILYDKHYEDALLYQFAENRSDLMTIIEHFYSSVIEYELEIEGLDMIPNESNEEEFQEWYAEVSDLLNEHIDAYFSGVIAAGYVATETVFELTMEYIKQCLA